jgi:hypothetical protein
VPEVPFWWEAGLVFAHVVPFICVLVHFYLGVSRLKLTDVWISIPVTTLYVCCNFYYTKSMNMPVYPFLTWTYEWKTIFLSFLCWLFGYLCYVGSSFVQEWRLGRPFKNCL